MISKYGKIILGIDPGLANLGYGIIVDHYWFKIYLTHGCIFTSKNLDTISRLIKINNALEQLIKIYNISLIIIENVFHSNNSKTSNQINQVIGSLLLTIGKNKVRCFQITPIQTKKILNLNRYATKKDIIQGIKNKFSTNSFIQSSKIDDACDGLVISLFDLKNYLFT